MNNMNKMTTCLWFDHGKAREAAEFYASVFPDSHVGKAHASAVDNPSAKVGEDLIVANRRQQFHPAIEVALHQVGAADVHLLVAAVEEPVHP